MSKQSLALCFRIGSGSSGAFASNGYLRVLRIDAGGESQCGMCVCGVWLFLMLCQGRKFFLDPYVVACNSEELHCKAPLPLPDIQPHCEPGLTVYSFRPAFELCMGCNVVLTHRTTAQRGEFLPQVLTFC